MSSIQGDPRIAGVAGAPPVARSATARPATDRPASARPATRHRRPLSNMVVHAPHLLRALVRADEVWLVALAAVVGALAGVMVWFMTVVTQLIHQALFLISASERLSAVPSLPILRALAVPTLGGLA